MEKEKDQKAYAHAEKAYMQGTLFPFVKVGMQKVNLTPTVTVVDGKKVMTPNAPVYVYDYLTRRCGTVAVHHLGIWQDAP